MFRLKIRKPPLGLVATIHRIYTEEPLELDRLLIPSGLYTRFDLGLEIHSFPFLGDLVKEALAGEKFEYTGMK